MSTNNFAFSNILVAVKMECDDDAEMFANCDVPNLQNELDRVLDGEISNGYYNDGLSRSYGGKEIYRAYIYTTAGDVYKKITVLWRSGYYADANIDYEIEDGEMYSTPPKGTKTLDKKVASVCRRIESIVRKYGTPLNKVGQFSNGEAVYELAK